MTYGGGGANEMSIKLKRVRAMVIMDLLSKRAITVSAAVLALSLAACETTPTTKPVSIDSTAVADADFSSYKSYYVLPVPPGKDGVTPAKPFSRVTVEKAVRGELGARNYVETADKEAADMLVAIQFSLKDETTYKTKRPTKYGLTSIAAMERDMAVVMVEATETLMAVAVTEGLAA